MHSRKIHPTFFYQIAILNNRGQATATTDTLPFVKMESALAISCLKILNDGSLQVTKTLLDLLFARSGHYSASSSMRSLIRTIPQC